MFDDKIVLHHALIENIQRETSKQHSEHTSRFKNRASWFHLFLMNSLHSSTTLVDTVAGRIDKSPFSDIAFLRTRPAATFEAPLMDRLSPALAASLWEGGGR